MNKLKIKFINGNTQPYDLDNIYKTELTDEYFVILHDKGILNPDLYYRSHIEEINMFKE